MLYILSAYKITYNDYPDVFIIGIYQSFKTCSRMQKILCGKIKQSGNTWIGRDNICSWIHKIEIGTLKKAVNTRDTSTAIFCEKAFN